RIHMQVISDNYRQIPSVAFQRRQSVPVNSSLRLVQVLKLPRQCRHQSLKIQDDRQVQKFDAKPTNVIHRIIPSTNNIHSTNRKSTDVNDILQSVKSFI
ncbi:unnamed protein product, partial [Adineta steineri]